MSTVLRQKPWHKARKLDLRSIFRGGVDGAIYQPADPNVLLTRRNRFTYSQVLSNATWTKTNILSTTDDADGVGDFIVATTTNATHVVSQLVAQVGTANTVKVRAEPNGYNWIAIGLSSGGQAAYFNVSAGGLGIVSGGVASIAAAADAPGYYDCTFTATPTTTQVLVYICTANATASFAGDGVSGVNIARAQVEWNTSTATEYQPITDWTTQYLGVNRYELIQQWQESTGVTPVMVAETACGLRMDNSRSLVRGPEVVTNQTFDSNLTGWTAGSSVVASWVAGEAQIAGGGTLSFSGNNWFYTGGVTGAAANDTYEVIFDATWVSGGVMYAGVGYNGVTIAANGGVKTRYSVRVASSSAGAPACFGTAAGAVWLIDNVSCKRVPGNHALQATSAARPVVSQRYNILPGLPVTPVNGGVGSVPTVTQNYLSEAGVVRVQAALNGGATTAAISVVTATTISAPLTGVSYKGRVEVKATSAGEVGKVILLRHAAGGSYGTHTLTADWTTFERSETSLPSSQFDLGLRGGFGASDSADFLFRRADLRTADDAAKSIPAYQYVNTATDMATDGFPAYEKFDGTDDSRTSATGGGSTTGFFWCGVVTVGGAGTTRIMYSDLSGNSGFEFRIVTSDILRLYVGNGAAFLAADSAASLTVGTTYVLTAWYDGVNGYVQINNGTPAASASVTAAAGTAGFTEGKSNAAASGYLNGRMYGRVYTKNFCPSASQREQVKRELARQAGCLHLIA